MEAVVFEDSPLASYLEGEGENSGDWAPAQNREIELPDNPSFAPRGRPTVQPRFRQRLPPRLRVQVPNNKTIAAIHESCSKAVNSRLGRVENGRFLEQIRYLIVASQLLSDYSHVNQSTRAILPGPEIDGPQLSLSITGAVASGVIAFLLVWAVHWARGGDSSSISKSRVTVVLCIVAAGTLMFYAYVRRQWLQYLRRQSLSEVSAFVDIAHEFDAAATASMTLIQEVELVSRGYRLSTPLPPITRLEDKSQARRCVRLRKALHASFASVIPRYNEAYSALKPLAEQIDLEKYLDIYDINEIDRQEAETGYLQGEFEDLESLKVAKVLAARFHTLRKLFLCCLLALDADGGKTDFDRWGVAIDELQATASVSREAADSLRAILDEQDSFPVPTTPKIPLTPGREKWRAQLRQLGSLSSGIRSLQAKLHLLREESDQALNESEDISELGLNLMDQFESIGADLKNLMQEWEDSKTALALNIDRNHKRLSSMSGMMSPTLSLGGVTSVDEGSPTDALRALNGESRGGSSPSLSSSDFEEVFEAVAAPKQRPRSTMTREERIAKVKEDRLKRESLREQADYSTKMLRELESVINLRPRTKVTPKGRVTSL